MKANLKLENGMRFSGTNESGLITYFDTHPQFGGENTAPTPMEVMLQCLSACTSMDVLSMLRKRKKNIEEFNIELEADKSPEHPKVFTIVKMIYKLKSPDVTIDELNYAVTLSQDKYCGISAMFRRSGCDVLWETRLI